MGQEISHGPEAVQAKRALNRTIKLIRELAACDGDSAERDALWFRAIKASHRAEDLARFCNGDLQVSCATVGKWIGPATEQAMQNAKARRDSEIARLSAEIRAARPQPSTYEHELALLRGKK